MKRRVICFRVWALLMLLAGALRLLGQTAIAMPHNSGQVSISLDPLTNCSYVFTDNGGNNATYGAGAGAGSTITFLPSAPGNKITVRFLTFHTEPEYDGLFVYDGPNTLSPQISSGAPALLAAGGPTGSGAWHGTLAPYNVAPATLRATASNASGALTFSFFSDPSVEKAGWTAIVAEVPGSACTLQAPGALTVTAPAGSCSADVQTALPNILPGACAQAMTLRYRLNDGPFVAVASPLPPSLSIPDVPVGLNVLSWELAEPCAGGLVAGAVQLVTVKDQSPPVLTVPSSITLTLDPGQCAGTYDYIVSAVDQCPGDSVRRVSHPLDFDNGAAGVMFDVRNLGAEPVVITGFEPALEAGNWALEVYMTESAAGWQPAAGTPSAWRLAGTKKVSAQGPSQGTPLTGFELVLPPGASRGIYLASTSGAPFRLTGTGSGTQRQYDDGVLQVSSSPGASAGYPFGVVQTSRAYNGSVLYRAGRLSVQQLSGLPGGSAFPIGTTVNLFQVTDASGNTVSASFSVTVKPFASPVSTLVCAGMVNTSLGPDCATTLGADDILIGGPYACFENYLVQLDKIPPFQDGPWVPAYLTSADVGKTYGVRVTDPQNGNVCLGNILVEDKLPPTLSGPDVTLPCNFDLEPTQGAKAVMFRKFPVVSGLPRTVSDFKSIVLDIPVNVPADAVVEDLDVALRVTGDVFEQNLWIELENPAGKKALLWKPAGGCAGPLWLRFDDEAPAGQECSRYSTNQRARIPFNANMLALFDGQAAKGTWKLRLRDTNGFGDVAVVEEASLELRYSATFSAGFPAGLTFPGTITQVAQTAFVVPAPLLDGCSDVNLSYSDEMTSMPCSTGMSAVVNRTWTARDASNNTAKFVQKIQLMRPSLSDVILPPDFNDIDAPALVCGGAFPVPGWIEDQGKQGFPYVFGQPDGCSVNWSYADVVVNSCPGSYTINRTWSIVDACTAQSTQRMQLIQVLDRQAPAMSCPANLTVSTDLYTCCATVNLPDVAVSDACSAMGNLRANVVIFNQYSGDTVQVATVGGSLTAAPGNGSDSLATFGNTPCLPVGNHHVYYRVEDACGNLKACSFALSVRDYTPPVAVGQSLVSVSLNADDPGDCYEPGANGALFSGVVTLPASAFDQGSYDNCNFVRVTVRRKPPYSDCIKSLNQVNGAPPCQDGFPDIKSEFNRATAESDSIKFYCCEAGTTQSLVLRCYQLNALGQYSLDANGQPIYNETSVQVMVQDKLKPGCQAPADLAISCENFDPTLSDYGLPSLQDNCCLDTTKVFQGKPGLQQTLDMALFDTICNRGTLARTFTVYDCQGQTSQCTQRITVSREVDFAIRFPDDVVVPLCDSSGYFGQPEFFGKDCESLAISFSDELFTVIPGACYQIERTWRVIDWCDHLPGGACVTVPNPTPDVSAQSPQNLAGPILAPPGTPAPWTASVVKVTPNSPQATDYSTFWDPAINCYAYTQVIKVIDSKPPVVEDCPDDPTSFGDQTANASDLWHETYWYDGTIDSHNLCEGPADLTTAGSSLCAGANVNIRYLLFLDLDGDGEPETVVNSAKLPPPNTVMYGNAANPDFSGGTARAFDKRPLSPTQQYAFALKKTVSGSKMTAAVRWNSQQAPDTYVVPELPYGKHMVRWIISDGCGNETLCENQFVVKDEKAPTVVCLNGLSVNINPSTTVQLWVSDLLQYAEDNYSPVGQIRFGIRLSGTGTGFPFESDGVTPQSGITFTCSDIGQQLVELWAMDATGNADYCETYVIVQDNQGNCTGNNSGTVAGSLKTEAGKGLENAGVVLTGNNAAVPPGGLAFQTDNLGSFAFNNLPLAGGDLTVAPFKDDDPLNGVSTFDLVLINKHILGLEPLNSPYKMIAADANNSRSLTTFDVVELRKLILGIYTDFPDNTSWRFIDKDYVFPNPANPFQEVFPEVRTAKGNQYSLLNYDFISAKTGDVNLNAVTSSLVQADERTSGELLFDVDDRAVKAGETFTATFRAAEKVKGYQYTLYFPNLEVLEVTPGPGMTLGNFGIFAAEHCLTTSFDNDPEASEQGEYAVTFRAKAGGRLSEMLNVSGRITKAEAYGVNVGNEGNVSNVGNEGNVVNVGNEGNVVNVVNVVNGGNVVNVGNEGNVVNVVNVVNGGNVGNVVNGGNEVNEVMGIALRFNGRNGAVIAGQGFELYQNAPNPWISRTKIGFYLPRASEATLTVYDETGRVLHRQTADFGKGYNAFTLDRPEASGMNTTGVLYYKVETPTDNAVKKMIQTR